MPSERFLARLNESKWIFEHNGTAVREFVSRDEAIAAARARARERRGEFAIERDDGTLERERFGREPRDTKGSAAHGVSMGEHMQAGAHSMAICPMMKMGGMQY